VEWQGNRDNRSLEGHPKLGKEKKLVLFSGLSGGVSVWLAVDNLRASTGSLQFAFPKGTKKNFSRLEPLMHEAISENRQLTKIGFPTVVESNPLDSTSLPLVVLRYPSSTRPVSSTIHRLSRLNRGRKFESRCLYGRGLDGQCNVSEGRGGLPVRRSNIRCKKGSGLLSQTTEKKGIPVPALLKLTLWQSFATAIVSMGVLSCYKRGRI